MSTKCNIMPIKNLSISLSKKNTLENNPNQSWDVCDQSSLCQKDKASNFGSCLE